MNKFAQRMRARRESSQLRRAIENAPTPAMRTELNAMMRRQIP